MSGAPNQFRTRAISIPNASGTPYYPTRTYETPSGYPSMSNGRRFSPPSNKMASNSATCTPEQRRRNWASAAAGNGNVSPSRQTQRQRSYSFRARGNKPVQNQADGFRPRVSTMPSDALRPKPCGSQRSSFSGYRWGREDSLSPKNSLRNSVADCLFFGEDRDFYLLRNFTVTPKGDVINKGDLVRQRSRSATSVTTSNGGSPGTSPATSCSSSGLAVGSRKTSVFCYDQPTIHKHPHYRIRMLGALGVGKSALVSQFKTSEFMNAYEWSQDEDIEKIVSVLLDGEEYELTFIDHPISADLQDDCNERRDWDPLRLSPPACRGNGGNNGSGGSEAYLVVYSVTDRGSFEKAIDLLFALRERVKTLTHAVILVGNKSDLVRTREVSIEEGKSVACTYECKFIETSAAIGHRVDELLVGLLTQIRLKARQMSEIGVFRHRVSSVGGSSTTSNATPTPGSPAHLWSPRSSNASSTTSSTALFHFSRRRAHQGSLRYDRGRAKSLLDRLLCRGETAKHKSKSCDNLYVL